LALLTVLISGLYGHFTKYGPKKLLNLTHSTAST